MTLLHLSDQSHLKKTERCFTTFSVLFFSNLVLLLPWSLPLLEVALVTRFAVLCGSFHSLHCWCLSAASRHAGDLAVWVLSVTVPYRQAGTVSTIVLCFRLWRDLRWLRKELISLRVQCDQNASTSTLQDLPCVSATVAETPQLIKSADLLTAVYNVSQALVDFTFLSQM